MSLGSTWAFEICRKGTSSNVLSRGPRRAWVNRPSVIRPSKRSRWVVRNRSPSRSPMRHRSCRRTVSPASSRTTQRHPRIPGSAIPVNIETRRPHEQCHSSISAPKRYPWRNLLRVKDTPHGMLCDCALGADPLPEELLPCSTRGGRRLLTSADGHEPGGPHRMGRRLRKSLARLPRDPTLIFRNTPPCLVGSRLHGRRRALPRNGDPRRRPGKRGTCR